MISVILLTLNDEATLADALADLVPAAVDGLVREVLAVDGGSTDATPEILEDAGARVVSRTGTIGERLAAGAAAAKGAWLMVLPPGPALFPTWQRDVAQHIERHGDAVGLMKAERAGWWPGRGAEALLISRLRLDRSGGFAAGDKGVTGVIRRAGRPRRTLRVLL